MDYQGQRAVDPWGLGGTVSAMEEAGALPVQIANEHGGKGARCTPYRPLQAPTSRPAVT
jgi:hypothetical protein